MVDKPIQILFWMIVLLPLVLGTDYCDDEVLASTDCQIITPEIDCSTNLTIYNETLDLYKTASMTQIGSTKIYNYTFNEVAGSYFILLCDNSTREIQVRNTLHNKSDTIVTTTDSILVDTNHTTTYIDDIRTDIRTIIYVIYDRLLSFIWSDYTPREITGGNLTVDPPTVCEIANGTWDDDVCDVYKEIDNMR